MAHRHSRRSRKQILQDWSIEIIALTLVILAVVWLLELSIYDGVFTSPKTLLPGITELFSFVSVLLEPRNFGAIALLLLAIAFLGWRIRYRLMRTPRFVLKKCPVCGNSISRRHRRRLGHLVNYFIPIGRYHCKKCNWDGWRIRVQ